MALTFRDGKTSRKKKQIGITARPSDEKSRQCYIRLRNRGAGEEKNRGAGEEKNRGQSETTRRRGMETMAREKKGGCRREMTHGPHTEEREMREKGMSDGKITRGRN